MKTNNDTGVILSEFRALVICHLTLRDRYRLLRAAFQLLDTRRLGFFTLPVDSRIFHPYATTWTQPKGDME